MELLKEMKSSLSLHPMLISIVLCLRTTVEPLKLQSPQVPAMNKAPQCEVTSLSPAMLKTKKSQSILFRQLILLSASVENSSSRFFQISCTQGILNSSRLSCYLLLRLLVYMYLSQLMRTFTNYLKCIVISF